MKNSTCFFFLLSVPLWADLDLSSSEERIREIENSENLKRFINEGALYKIDLNDPLFRPEGIEDPKKALKIIDVEDRFTDQERALKVCRENRKIVTHEFEQELIVTPIVENGKDGKIEQVCKGHVEYTPGEDLRRSADLFEKQYAVYDKFLSSNIFISEYTIKAINTYKNEPYYVCYEIKYKHSNKFNGCKNRGPAEPEIISFEEDRWEIQNSEKLDKMAQDPRCKLVETTVTEGPAERKIKGVPVFRDAWKKKLVYQCETDEMVEDEKCAEFRANGGVLFKKTCIKEDDEGRCIQWEKTYDCGEWASKLDRINHFEVGHEIFGMQGEIDYKYKKSKDFAQVMAALATALEIGGSMLGQVESCPIHAATLPESVQEGRCHLVGIKENQQIFCCFPSKRARIIQEQIRGKINLDWGTPNDPRCEGFVDDESIEMDLSDLDMTELTEQIVIDQEFEDRFAELMKKMISNGVQRAIEEQSE